MYMYCIMKEKLFLFCHMFHVFSLSVLFLYLKFCTLYAPPPPNKTKNQKQKTKQNKNTFNSQYSSVPFQAVILSHIFQVKCDS